MSEAVITQKAQERLIALLPLSIPWIEAGAHLRIRLFHKATIARWQGSSHRQSDLAEGVYRKRAPAPGMSQSRTRDPSERGLRRAA